MLLTVLSSSHPKDLNYNLMEEDWFRVEGPGFIIAVFEFMSGGSSQHTYCVPVHTDFALRGLQRVHWPGQISSINCSSVINQTKKQWPSIACRFHIQLVNIFLFYSQVGAVRAGCPRLRNPNWWNLENS